MFKWWKVTLKLIKILKRKKLILTDDIFYAHKFPGIQNLMMDRYEATHIEGVWSENTRSVSIRGL